MNEDYYCDSCTSYQRNGTHFGQCPKCYRWGRWA